MTPEQESCPHIGLIRTIEDGEPKNGWTCARCGLKFVTQEMLIEIIGAVAKAMSLTDIDV